MLAQKILSPDFGFFEIPNPKKFRWFVHSFLRHSCLQHYTPYDFHQSLRTATKSGNSGKSQGIMFNQKDQGKGEAFFKKSGIIKEVFSLVLLVLFQGNNFPHTQSRVQLNVAIARFYALNIPLLCAVLMKQKAFMKPRI